MKNKTTKKILLICIAYISFELTLYVGILILTGYGYLPKPINLLSSKHKKALKTVASQKKKQYTTFDPILGWTVVNNGRAKMATANAHGIRSKREYSLVPQKGIYRITTFGDSFTHGAEVNNQNTWQVQMERDKRKLEVLNFGVNGYGLDQAYLRYLHKGFKYKANAVFIGFMPENIFRGVNTFRPFYYPSTGIVFAKPRFIFEKNKFTLIENPLKKREMYNDLLANPQEILAKISKYDYYYKYRYKISAYDILPSFRLIRTLNSGSGKKNIINNGSYNTKHEAFLIVKKTFDIFYQAVIKNNSKAIILLFPDRKNILQYRKDKSVEYKPLIKYFDTVGYKYIDLMYAFSERKMESLFLHSHYSPLGNKLIARYIVKKLKLK
ncbi:hypothetical protein [Candidatus Uabimicrobium sp. HlEnr_7]|uniref:hypothetical protein n=1 Tax=Candidatus Uabimicrobium helgolandensis TaxID=3095367 RepID=UPI0035582468